MVNMQLLSSEKLVNMLSINLIMVEEGHLLYTKKIRYFSIIPRLQRLFTSPKTIEQMT
jgi:hypothetical protein